MTVEGDVDQTQLDAAAAASAPSTYDADGVTDPVEITRIGSEVETGRGAWTEFGVVGRPLRRGSFTRIGTDPDRDWSAVTGIVVLITTNASETVKVNLDDMYFRGGYGPDTTEVGAAP